MDWVAYVELLIKIFTLSVLTTGVLIATKQLKRLSISAEVARKSGMVNVVMAMVSKYHDIAHHIPDPSDEQKVKEWWESFYDLFTEEFVYYEEGLIEPKIYELWINELAEYYLSPPAEGFAPINENHQNHIQLTLPCYERCATFFLELENICKSTKNPLVRAKSVSALVQEFKPKKLYV